MHSALRVIAFALVLALAVLPQRQARGEELRLAVASAADSEVLAELTLHAWWAWYESDAAAILATADPSLFAHLEKERDLALTLPVEPLLPPFGGEAQPCVPLAATARILAMRQAHAADALQRLSDSELLALVLQVPGGAARSSRYNLVSYQKQTGSPAEFFRSNGMGFGISGDTAYRIKDNWAFVAAKRDTDGHWHFDYRQLLVLEEMELQIAWAYGLMGYAVEHGLHKKPEANDWPVDEYLEGLTFLLPGQPSPDQVRALAELPVAGEPPACWRATLEPPLLWCFNDSEQGLWHACPL